MDCLRWSRRSARSPRTLKTFFAKSARAATFSKLPPGTHPIHVHTVGSCTTPDFTSDGGHFIPDAKQHGSANPHGSHAGDLPNFEVDAKGNGTISFAAPDKTLNDGPNALLSWA